MHITKLSLATAALLLMATTASARPDCSAISGNWSGTMKGEKFNGPISMTVNDRCKVNWRLPDNQLNKCDYFFRGKQLKYKCSLKSRGNVTISGNRIIMQNVDTAKQHGEYTATFSR